MFLWQTIVARAAPTQTNAFADGGKCGEIPPEMRSPEGRAGAKYAK
jgi:hypothetical protein